MEEGRNRGKKEVVDSVPREAEDRDGRVAVCFWESEARRWDEKVAQTSGVVAHNNLLEEEDSELAGGGSSIALAEAAELDCLVEEGHCSGRLEQVEEVGRCPLVERSGDGLHLVAEVLDDECCRAEGHSDHARELEAYICGVTEEAVDDMSLVASKVSNERPCAVALERAPRWHLREAEVDNGCLALKGLVVRVAAAPLRM